MGIQVCLLLVKRVVILLSLLSRAFGFLHKDSYLIFTLSLSYFKPALENKCHKYCNLRIKLDSDDKLKRSVSAP